MTLLERFFRWWPRPVRRKLYKIVARQVTFYEKKNAEAIEASLPHIELSDKYIRNLRVVTTRDALLSMLPHHSVVAEVGVEKGDFSERILSITSPQALHLIDAWADGQYRSLRPFVENRLKHEIKQGHVVIHQGRSTSELVKFKDSYFDWVYIDTSHDYRTTSMELELCRCKVKADGIIAGHDYVTGSWLHRRRYGVIEAVHEFCVKYNWEIIYLTHESDRHLSFAIRELSKSGHHEDTRSSS